MREEGKGATETEAARAIRLALGQTPIRLKRMTFGHNSVTYDAVLSNASSVIIRTNAKPSVFAGTERNLVSLAGLGLPVPTILASDLSCQQFPFAYLILAKIPGRDLRYELAEMTRSQMTRLASQIVEFQRSVSTLPLGSGFGYVPIGESAPFPTWKALLDAEVPAVTDDFSAYEQKITQNRDRLDDYFSQVSPVCFLDDTTTKNVIVEHGELRGLIDFDVVCYGDPLLMVGLTAAAVTSDVGRDALFYVDELRRLWDLTGEQEHAANLYSAQMTLAFLRRFTVVETPGWNSRMRNALDRWLAS